MLWGEKAALQKGEDQDCSIRMRQSPYLQMGKRKRRKARNSHPHSKPVLYFILQNYAQPFSYSYIH